MTGAEDLMRREVREGASKVIALVDKYSERGPHRTVLENLRGLRNQRLAHRQTEATAVTTADATDVEIESFYQDNSELNPPVAQPRRSRCL